MNFLVLCSQLRTSPPSLLIGQQLHVISSCSISWIPFSGGSWPVHSVPHLHICTFWADINLSSAGLQTSQSFIYCLSAYLSHLQEPPDTSTRCYCGRHITGQILPAQQLFSVCASVTPPCFTLCSGFVKETTRSQKYMLSVKWELSFPVTSCFLQIFLFPWKHKNPDFPL